MLDADTASVTWLERWSQRHPHVRTSCTMQRTAKEWRIRLRIKWPDAAGSPRVRLWAAAAPTLESAWYALRQQVIRETDQEC